MAAWLMSWIVACLAGVVAGRASPLFPPRAGKGSGLSRLRGGESESRGGETGSRRFGCLIVGLGGNNGCTVAAGQVANAMGASWEGEKRACDADWTGCVTQTRRMATRGLRSFEECAIGGWDVRPTRVGQALLEGRILDLDLARQLRSELDEVEVMRGVYDERYVGESQRAGATHVKEGLHSAMERVDALRGDIRDFKEAHGVDGHCTVIWSASVEPRSLLSDDAVRSADALLATLESDDGNDAPPSLLYATAAALVQGRRRSRGCFLPRAFTCQESAGS